MMARPSWRGHFTNALLPPRGAKPTPRPPAAGLPEIAESAPGWGWGSSSLAPLQPTVVQAARGSSRRGRGGTTTTRAAAAPLPHATSLPNRRHGSPAGRLPTTAFPRSETNKQAPRSGPAHGAPAALAVPQSPAAARRAESALRSAPSLHKAQPAVAPGREPRRPRPPKPQPPRLSLPPRRR